MKGSYFSSTAHAVRQGQLTLAPADLLLAPPVRTARDAAYDAALTAGHSPEVAAAAAAVAARAVIAMNPLNVALVIAAATAHSLMDGYSPELSTSAAECAADLFASGFSAGAALAGARAYTEARFQGQSDRGCLEAASVAAASACEQAAAADPNVLAALSRGEIPPDVFVQSAAAGAEACAAGHSSSAVALGSEASAAKK